MSRGERRPAPRAPSTGPKQRVQKLLARAGLASRRQAEALIAAGRVRVGGKRLDRQGVMVDPRRDDVSVDGKRVSAEPLTYLLFHKPREVMCTMQDPLGRRSVVDFLRGAGARVVPVGRLDYQTGGVLLLTNDGDFAREMLHPSSGVTKEYLLKVKGPVDVAGLQRLRERIDIGGKWTKPARVERMRADDTNSWLLVSLQEGKNRQVRRLAENAGYRVMRLTRTRFAGLTAEGLRPGQWRELTASELRTLRAHNSAHEEAATAEPSAAVPARGRGRPNKPSRPGPKLQRAGGRAPRKSGERASAGNMAGAGNVANAANVGRGSPRTVASQGIASSRIASKKPASGSSRGAAPKPRFKRAESDPEGLRPGHWPELTASELRSLRGDDSAQEEAAAAEPSAVPARGRGRSNKPSRPGPKPQRSSGVRSPHKSGERANEGRGAPGNQGIASKKPVSGSARGAGAKPRFKGPESDPRKARPAPARQQRRKPARSRG